MKLDGTQVFSAMFTVLNEMEQNCYQVFVPTKSLLHIRSGLEGIVTSLKSLGLPEPILGYTDNVAQDIGTFVACIPSLGANVNSVQLDEFSDLPHLALPQDVSIHTFSCTSEIQSACLNILDLIRNDEVVLHVGFDMEWEFSTGLTGTGPQKSALVQIALPKIVYLFQVYALQKLPHSLETIIQSQQIVKIGQNIAADFAKLAQDFPGLKLPQKQGKFYFGTIELGKLAVQKNIVSNGNASLAAITAATLQKYLSKECRQSEWGQSKLSDSQIQYAALDAHVALQIWDVLRDLEPVGQPLSTATRVGTLVSLYVKKQEVAYGTIIEQPAKYTIPVGPENRLTTFGVSTTCTHALIRVDKVLASSCIIALHKKTLQALQGDMETFNILVSICALRTRDKESAPQLATAERHNIGKVTASKPGDAGIGNIAILGSGSETLPSDSDSNTDSDSEGIQQPEYTDSPGILYKQPSEMLESIPSCVLADVFHIIDWLCRTISRKHTAYKKFATAFSDTMLIPDQDDKQL